MFWFYTLPAIRNHIFAALAILLSHFIFDGHAIKCFVCDSTDNPSCTDLKSNSSLVSEECTLLNLRSNNSWLFELNALAFYKAQVYNDPLFTCQKIVAREPLTNRNVTARFCQMHTAGSDACKILRNRMAKQEADRHGNNGFNGYSRRNSYSAYDNNNNGGDDDSSSKDRVLHCSVCYEDNCNVGASLFSANGSAKLLQLLLLLSPLALWQLLPSTSG